MSRQISLTIFNVAVLFDGSFVHTAPKPENIIGKYCEINVNNDKERTCMHQRKISVALLAMLSDIFVW